MTNRVVKLYAPSVDARDQDRVDPAFPTEDLKADELLRRIPDAQNTMVVPFKTCDITEPNVERHANSKECSETMKLFPKKLLWMEEADGDLWSALFSTQLDDVPVATLVKAMRNLLLGMQKLHATRVIHRDIKPNNVLWKRTGEGIWIKLADFGISLFDPADFEELRKEDLYQLSYVFAMVFNKYGVTAAAADTVHPFLAALRAQESYEDILAKYDAIVGSVGVAGGTTVV